MKSKLLNQILKEKELYTMNCRDLKELEKEYPSSMYSNEYITGIIKKAKEENEVNKTLFQNKVNTLRNEFKSLYTKDIADELLKSNVSAYRNILEGDGLLTDCELQALYNKANSECDVLGNRYLTDYIQKNNREIEIFDITSSQEKVETVDSICDQSIKYIDRPLEFALLEQQMNTKYDSILD